MRVIVAMLAAGFFATPITTAHAQPDNESLWNGPWSDESYHFGGILVKTVLSRKTGDTIQFRSEEGAEIGYLRGRVLPSGQIRWEIKRFTKCRGDYWDHIQVTISNGGRRLEYDTRVTDYSSCRVYGSSPHVLRRQ